MKGIIKWVASEPSKSNPGLKSLLIQGVKTDARTGFSQIAQGFIYAPATNSYEKEQEVEMPENAHLVTNSYTDENGVEHTSEMWKW